MVYLCQFCTKIQQPDVLDRQCTESGQISHSGCIKWQSFPTNIHCCHLIFYRRSTIAHRARISIRMALFYDVNSFFQIHTVNISTFYNGGCSLYRENYCRLSVKYPFKMVIVYRFSGISKKKTLCVYWIPLMEKLRRCRLPITISNNLERAFIIQLKKSHSN